jgi:hypothetical protein
MVFAGREAEWICTDCNHRFNVQRMEYTPARPWAGRPKSETAGAAPADLTREER